MSSYGLWLSAAGMKVNDHRQTILANNLANAATAGFKHDLAVIMQRRVESRESPRANGLTHPVLDAMPGGVEVRPTYYSRQQGAVEWTGRPLDVAIDGEGFFQVFDGEVTRYTRNGEFTMNPQGELVMANAAGLWRVLDDAGVPILLDPTGGRVEVSQDGTIRQGRSVVARLGLVTNSDSQKMRKVGENLFESTGGRIVPVEPTLAPKSREASTFNAVEGLVGMIEASRAFQLNATLLQLQDDLTGQAVTTLGRVA